MTLNRRLMPLLAGLAVLGSAAFGWWMRAPTQPALEVKPAALVRTLQFSARVTSSSRVDVGATVTGRVANVVAVEGQRVKRGEVLLRLETDELRAALAQATATERQAAARLTGLRGTGRRASEALVAQAEANLLAAQAEWRRSRELVAQGFVSAARLDEAQRAVDVALAQRASAREQAAAQGEQGADIAQAQAQQALAAAATNAARARLAQAEITAPADALVLARLVEPGQIVQPGRALLALALAGPTELLAQVDERYLEQLQPGQAAHAVPDAFPDRRFDARVKSIAARVDAQRGAVEVKLEPPTPVPPFLREDMTLSVEVQTARRDQALVVPLAALREGPAGQTQVLLVRDGRVETRDVVLGLRTLDAAEVREGLAAGDVVLLGPARAPGQRVRPDTSAAAAALASRRKAEDAGAAMTNAFGR